MVFLAVAFHLVSIAGTDGKTVEVNPAEVVSLRPPPAKSHPSEIRCLIHTSDGKFIAVVEDCATVHDKLEAAENEE